MIVWITSSIDYDAKSILQLHLNRRSCFVYFTLEENKAIDYKLTNRSVAIGNAWFVLCLCDISDFKLNLFVFRKKIRTTKCHYKLHLIYKLIDILLHGILSFAYCPAGPTATTWEAHYKAFCIQYQCHWGSNPASIICFCVNIYVHGTDTVVTRCITYSIVWSIDVLSVIFCFYWVLTVFVFFAESMRIK